ncbi:hypothetical protein DFH11DRAFT_1743163 [Phellopilus nigrolimitatus]|nr:hypothetical protein DFH11DRAFT_1743163 [Phellopilus nigrolimitatus]
MVRKCATCRENGLPDDTQELLFSAQNEAERADKKAKPTQDNEQKATDQFLYVSLTAAVMKAPEKEIPESGNSDLTKDPNSEDAEGSSKSGSVSGGSLKNHHIGAAALEKGKEVLGNTYPVILSDEQCFR